MAVRRARTTLAEFVDKCRHLRREGRGEDLLAGGDKMQRPLQRVARDILEQVAAGTRREARAEEPDIEVLSEENHLAAGRARGDVLNDLANLVGAERKINEHHLALAAYLAIGQLGDARRLPDVAKPHRTQQAHEPGARQRTLIDHGQLYLFHP